MTTAPEPESGPTRVADRNALGTASLVVGVLLLLWSILVSASSAALPYMVARLDLPYAMIPLVSAIPTFLLGILAVALGIIALLKRGQRRTAAVIGTTIGATQLLILVVGMAGSVMFSLALR